MRRDSTMCPRPFARTAAGTIWTRPWQANCIAKAKQRWGGMPRRKSSTMLHSVSVAILAHAPEDKLI